MYRAVLDTCALVPGRQRDFLLQLAAVEAYAPLWGSGILFGFDYVLSRLDARRRREGSDERRAGLLAEMRRAFPGAEINAPKDREYDYGLIDPDDGHVAHAAILGKADAIVTDDTRAGFETAAVLLDAGIEIVRPQDFAANTVAAPPMPGFGHWSRCRVVWRLPRKPRSRSCSNSRIVRDGRGRRSPLPSTAGGSMSALADDVLPLIRTRAELDRWNTANARPADARRWERCGR